MSNSLLLFLLTRTVLFFTVLHPRYLPSHCFVRWQQCCPISSGKQSLGMLLGFFQWHFLQPHPDTRALSQASTRSCSYAGYLVYICQVHSHRTSTSSSNCEFLKNSSLSNSLANVQRLAAVNASKMTLSPS